MAVELTALAADIETIGAELCADPTVAQKHGAVLQAVDAISQRQRALAELLVAEKFADALGACNLGRIVDLFSRQSA